MIHMINSFVDPDSSSTEPTEGKIIDTSKDSRIAFLEDAMLSLISTDAHPLMAEEKGDSGWI